METVRLIAVIALIVAASAFCSAVQAAGLSYVCEVTDFLIPPGQSKNAKWMAEVAAEVKGKTVTIDRQTGHVIGPVLGNSFFPRKEVLDFGSEDWSYDSIALSAGPEHFTVNFYQVKEFHQGLEKPFLAVVDGTAYVGTCR